MRMQTTNRILALAAAACLGLAWPARAVTITEYFNNYGESSANLIGLGADEDGDGTVAANWIGAWTDSDRPDYYAGTQLAYNAVGYSNAGNETDADDGAAGLDLGGLGNAGSKARRGITSPGLGGTVWVSALAQVTTNTGEVLLWLGGASANNYIAIRNGQPAFRYNGSDQSSGAGGVLNDGQAHLLLARIQVNINDTANDTIEFWLDPDLSGGEAGLAAQTHFTGSGAHVLGTDSVNPLNLSAVQVSFANAGSVIDAIRISNDADGFLQVTAVPEPASLGLMGGGMLLLAWRRH